MHRPLDTPDSRTAGDPRVDLERSLARLKAKEQAFNQETRGQRYDDMSPHHRSTFDYISRERSRLNTLQYKHNRRRDRRSTRSTIHSGHRKQFDPDRQRISFNERLDRALLDLGIYRTIALQDLCTAHFDGHPYTARRGLDKLKRQGLLTEHTAHGPKTKPYKVLTLTDRGKDQAWRLRDKRGLDPGQQLWSGYVKQADMAHEVAIFRAAQIETGRLQAEGHRIKRIRLDAELKRIVSRTTESARHQDGKRAADKARRQAAEALDLPVENHKVIYPDAQIEYEDSAGRSGRANIEVVTDSYRASSIASKAKAGFALYASSGASARAGRALGKLPRFSDGGEGRRGSSKPDDPVIEL